jgi:hypothetical protein
MAGKLSHVGSANAQDGALGRATQTARTVYLALLTAAPSQTSTLGTMTEYGATGYSRQAIAFSAPTGTPRVSANSGVISYGPFTAGTGSTITHWAVVSASSGTSGDFIAYGDFTSSRTPGTGDTASVAIGAVTVSID